MRSPIAGGAGGVTLGSGVQGQVVCTSGHTSAVEWGHAFDVGAIGYGLSSSFSNISSHCKAFYFL